MCSGSLSLQSPGLWLLEGGEGYVNAGAVPGRGHPEMPHPYSLGPAISPQRTWVSHPTDLLSRVTFIGIKPGAHSNACSQLPWLGGQAGGGVDRSADGHLGQRPEPETVGVGPAVRSASGLVGATSCSRNGNWPGRRISSCAGTGAERALNHLQGLDSGPEDVSRTSKSKGMGLRL